MKWRRQPPVLSPVSVRALLSGSRAAIGFGNPGPDSAEQLLCQSFNACEAVLTDSGTSALVLALRKLVGSGGTVAFPGYACIDLTAAAVAADVRVRLYDLNPSTLSPDLDSVRRAMRRGVDAIVVAHLFGYAADVAGVKNLAELEGIPVIEDAAQGACAVMLGARLGSIGDVGILSFGRGKGTTTGSGGALLANTSGTAEWLQSERATLGPPARGGMHIVTLLAQRVLSNPVLYSLPASIPALKLGEMVFHPARRPRAISRAGRAILPHALAIEARELEIRRRRASEILLRLREARQITAVRPIAGSTPGFLRIAALDTSSGRAPRTDLGIVRGYPQTLEEHRELQPLLLVGERAGTGSKILCDTLFTIPTHSRVDGACMNGLEGWLNPTEIADSVLAVAG